MVNRRGTNLDMTISTSTPQELKIKGIRDGLLVTLGEGDWQEVQANLLSQISQKASFFKGARLALEVGNRILHAAEMGALRDKLSDQEITLWAVISNSPVTESTAQVLGMATRLAAPKAEKVVRSSDTNLPGEDAILIQKTLRSGFRVSTHGHVVVIGDVNPGAEIIADGNVIVWGRLRGAVHAGADGNAESLICAMEVNPTQLRIANIFYAPTAKKKKSGPEIVRIKNGQAVSEPWGQK
jgi:septum site-determining protein MinC